MPTMPQFAIVTTDLMAAFLFVSGLAMLIAVLVGLLYVISINTAGKSLAIDAGVGVLAFVLSNVWIASILKSILKLKMMALYNAVGAGAIVALGLSGYTAEGVLRFVAAFIGAMSVSGSLIAWIKLNGIFNEPLRVRGRHTFSLALMLAILAVAGFIVFTASGGVDLLIATPSLVGLLFGFALILGALTMLPIGRVQVPAAIFTCNALTALLVSLEGLALRSPMLVLAGVVVGAARILTTLQMVTDGSAAIHDGPQISAARCIAPSKVRSHV